jgi:phospholipid/cholesterol/gamma-HCH transport system substrate-binding protein
MSSLSKEFKVGLFAVAGLALVLTAVIITTKVNIASRGYTLNVRYNSVSDLKEGSAVIFAGGIKVGYIRAITMVSNQLNVRCWIEHKYKIDRNALLIITSSGLMGNKFLNIETLQPSGTYFRPDETVIGVNPVSFDALTIKVGNALNSLFGEAFMSEDMKKSFVYALRNISELLYNLNQTVKSNEDNVALSVERASETIDLLHKNLKTILESLNYTVKNAENLSREHSDQIKRVIVDLEKTTAAVELASRDLKVVVANARDITDAIKNQQGTIGKLVYDRTIYVSLQKSAKNIEEVTERMKKRGSLLKF